MTYEATTGRNSQALTVFKGTHIVLRFQDGPIKDYGENGTTNEEIIRLLIERIESLNMIMSSDFNDQAINYLEAALGKLNNRTKERQERGVEGTNQP